MPEVDFGGREAAWRQLFYIIREQFPYSRMKEAAVRDGAVVSFEEIQFTRVFARGVEPAKSLSPDTFDDQWLRFMRFCRTIRTGVLGEVHFSDGRPIRVSMRRGGMKLDPAASGTRRAQGGKLDEEAVVAA